MELSARLKREALDALESEAAGPRVLTLMCDRAHANRMRCAEQQRRTLFRTVQSTSLCRTVVRVVKCYVQ